MNEDPNTKRLNKNSLNEYEWITAQWFDNKVIKIISNN